MIDPKSHSEHRGMIESLLRYIPGFQGYLEREYRRDSDHLARQWMVERLQKSKPALDEYMLGLINAGQLDQLTGCERVKTRLDTLINKIRSAVRGYSGFFDYVQVNVDLLEAVYQHDMRLVGEVERLAHSIEQLASKPDGVAAVVADLLQQIDAVDDQFDQRRDMLNGLNA